MSPCENQNHEKFAQLVGIGTNATEAYRQVYGAKGNAAQVGACKLKAKLAKRISECRREFEASLKVVNKERAKKDLAPLYLERESSLQFLCNIVLTPIGDIDETSPLCQAIEYRTTPGNREHEAFETIKVRLPDKIRAIELHAKLMGWLEAEGKQAVTVNVAVVTEEKRKTIMERRRAALEIKAE